MPFIYSPLDFADHMYRNGFRIGKGMVIGIALTRAESRFDPKAKHVNDDGSTDRGIVQINDRWHPEVSDACAYDPACAAKEFWRISKNGTDFSPWAAYSKGPYREWMDWAWVVADANGRITKRDAAVADLMKQLEAAKAR